MGLQQAQYEPKDNSESCVYLLSSNCISLDLNARKKPLLFFLLREARKQPHPSTADRVRGGGTVPQIHMQVGPHSSRCCRKGPQGATPRTRPPAPPLFGRRPQAARSVHCTKHCPRTIVPAPSIKRTSSSNSLADQIGELQK